MDSSLPQMPRIVIGEIDQLSLTTLDQITFDSALFSKRDAARTKHILSILDQKISEPIYVDDNTDWNFSCKNEFSLFIDTSCMSRPHMGSVFAQLGRWLCQDNRHIVKLYLGYSLSRFSKQSDKSTRIKAFGTINDFFSGWTTDLERNMELIVGLGYEELKAWGAVEYLEVTAPWIFIPNSPEKKFLEEVLKNNKILLESSENKIINYDVLNPVDTFFRLKSLTWGLLEQSDVILLPFGPKIFYALSLLLGLLERNLSIWFIDSADDEHGASLDASSHSIIFSCQLSTNSEYYS